MLLLLLFENKYNIYSNDPVYITKYNIEYFAGKESYNTVISKEILQYFIREE